MMFVGSLKRRTIGRVIIESFTAITALAVVSGSKPLWPSVTPPVPPLLAHSESFPGRHKAPAVNAGVVPIVVWRCFVAVKPALKNCF